MNVIGFDDGPFLPTHRGNVLLVGVVCARTRMDGVVSGHVRRDGADATRTMIDLVRQSQFGQHIGAVLLQGIAVAGFNVVDAHELSRALEVPVIVVARHRPDFDAIRCALFSDDPPNRPRVRGAARKWDLIASLGEIERLGPSHRALRRSRITGAPALDHRLWIQRVGLSMEEARRVIDATTLHGNVPEALRLAHLIAGGIVSGRSRGRV